MCVNLVSKNKAFHSYIVRVNKALQFPNEMQEILPYKTCTLL